MLLCKATPGETYQVKQIDLPDPFLTQLHARGICYDTTIRILDARRTGNVVLLCPGGRFALGSFYTQRIVVSQL